MSKRTSPARAIARLHAHPNGRFYWKPEKKLRPHWKSVPLGEAAEPARAEARRLNREADAWFAKQGPRAAGLGAGGGAGVRTRQGPKTVGQVIALYKQSADWRKLAPSTQAQYTYELKRLEDEFGHDAAGTLDEARVDDWADELRETAPETLRHVCARGRTIYAWAARKKHVPRGVNPFKGVALGGGRKRKFRFTWADVQHILAIAEEEGRPSVGVALAIEFAMVQRVSDVIRFHDGIKVPVPGGNWPRLKFVQRKTMTYVQPAEIDMAMPSVVAELLDRYPPKPALLPGGKPGTELMYWIVSEETGEAYHEKTISRVFARILAAAIAKDPKAWKHLAGGQLRDGRRSGFVHRKINGASVEQICSLSGHSLNEGYDIVEHYLPRTPELADQADAFLKVSL